MLRLLIALLILAPSIAVGQTVVGASGNGVGFGAASGGGGTADWTRSSSCTEGTDCFCDGPISGFANLNRCYDWEDPQWDDEYTGSDALYASPSGNNGFRGGAGFFQTLFGGPLTSCAWTNGVPASPNVGYTCGYGTCAGGPWSADDWLQANSFACFASFTDGEVNLDDGFQAGDITLDGINGTDPFDGSRYWAERVATGRSSGNGASISDSLTTFGLTTAFAYPQTLDSGHARTVGATWDGDFLTYPWKHFQTTGGATLQFPLGNTGNYGDSAPFGAGSTGASDCSSLVSGSTQLIGSVSCPSGIFRFDAAAVGDCTAGTPGSTDCNSTNEFDRSRDWPLGTWACIRSKWGPHNSTNGEMYIDFQGPNDSAPRRILHITGLNFSSYYGGSIGSVRWDAHFNGNDSGIGSPDPTERPMHRFNDNLVIVNGEPPTCSEIGFEQG